MPQLQQSDCRAGDAEMITAQLTRITTALTLTPKDFKAQLYAALYDVRWCFLLPRVPIEWGQPRIDFTELEKAVYRGIAIFDREDGGLQLDSAPFNQGTVAAWPGDVIFCHMGWPG
jgi:hypothetical protein